MDELQCPIADPLRQWRHCAAGVEGASGALRARHLPCSTLDLGSSQED